MGYISLVATIIVGLGFIFISCSVPKSLDGRYIDPEILPYVQRFEQAYGRVARVNVRFMVSGLGTRSGTCYRYIDAQVIPDVFLNKEHWLFYTDLGKEELVFHELGHCVLHRDHIATWNKGIPDSIMYPYTFGDEYYYMFNREYYINELFGRIK